MDIIVEFKVDDDFEEKTKFITKLSEECNGKWVGQGVDFETNMRDIQFDFSRGEISEFIKTVKEKYPDIEIRTITNYSKN